VAVYQLSAVSDAQAINFHPTVGVLNSSQAIDVTGVTGTSKF
jgi:hypothetical protein